MNWKQWSEGVTVANKLYRVALNKGAHLLFTHSSSPYSTHNAGCTNTHTQNHRSQMTYPTAHRIRPSSFVNDSVSPMNCTWITPFITIKGLVSAELRRPTRKTKAGTQYVTWEVKRAVMMWGQHWGGKVLHPRLSMLLCLSPSSPVAPSPLLSLPLYVRVNPSNRWLCGLCGSVSGESWGLVWKGGGR